MLKKMMIGSAIVLLICLITVALLTPMAVADTITMAEGISSQYEAVNEQLTIETNGIKEVSLSGGRSIEYLTVTVSPDDKIHIYTDGFHDPYSQFTYVVDEGHLVLSNYWRGHNYNPWKEFTRENILKQIVREFTNRTPYVELQLPVGVAYDLDTPNVWSWECDLTVKQIHSGRYNQDNEDYHSGDAEEVPLEEDENTDPVSGLTAEQMLQITRDVRVENDALLALYRDYTEGDLSQETAIQTAYAIIDRVIPLLSPLAGMNGEEDYDARIALEDQLRTCLALNVQKSLLEISQDQLEAQYKAGTISKEEYYMQDLELDREQTMLDEELDNADYNDMLEEWLERFETALGYRLYFGEDMDTDDLGSVS